jgi:hypothetical protein
VRAWLATVRVVDVGLGGYKSEVTVWQTTNYGVTDRKGAAFEGFLLEKGGDRAAELAAAWRKVNP